MSGCDYCVHAVVFGRSWLPQEPMSIEVRVGLRVLIVAGAMFLEV